MDDASVIEAMLLRWGESPTGRTVTLLLPDDTPQHPFRGLRCGPSNGQRLAISVALISDDETEQPLEATEKPADEPKPKGGNGGHRLARQAGIVCQEGAFAVFLAEHWEKYSDFYVWQEGEVLDVPATVRNICSVDTRKQFDSDAAAAERWQRLYSRYQAWKQL